MSFFDWIIIAILGFFSIRSLFRGASREIFSLLALIFACFVSWRYYLVAVPFLSPYVTPRWAQIVAAFCSLFIITYFIVNISGWLLSKLLKTIRLGFLDKMAGAVVGAAKAYVIICCIVIIILFFPQGGSLLKDSVLISYGYPFIRQVVKIFPAPLKTFFEEKSLALKKVRKKE